MAYYGKKSFSFSKYILVIMFFSLVGMTLPGIIRAVVDDCSVYGSSVPSGYAPPVSPFSSGNLVRAFCDSASLSPVQVEAGKSGDANIAVYAKGWYYTGTQWDQITFTGTPLPGDTTGQYLSGMGTGSIPNPQDGRNYVVAYTCVNSGGAWKCGCVDTGCADNKWQLQAFDIHTGGQANCAGGDGLVKLGTSKDRYEDWPPACVGKPYKVNITGCAGSSGVRFNNFEFGTGAPPGLSVDKRLVTGTPAVPGTYEFFVRGISGTFTCAGGVRIIVSP